jgi:hypothetical protein
MYEHRSEPLLPARRSSAGLFRHGPIALGATAVTLGIGILGYHISEGLPRLDSLLNAAMILGGMGAVDALHTAAGKWFASFYALFAGMLFLGIAGIIAAPLLHRFLHWMHLERKTK